MAASLSAGSKRVLPGLSLSLGTSLLFVALILLLPLSGLFVQMQDMSLAQYWAVITDSRVVAAYNVTIWAAALAGSL